MNEMFWTEEVDGSRDLMPHSDIFFLLPSESVIVPEAIATKQGWPL